MMVLAIAGLVLVPLTGCLLWCAVRRLWELLVIVGLALLLFPLLATQATGDASRYFPQGTFAEGIAGKNQVAIVSAATTLLIAIILACIAWGAARAAWRCIRGRMGSAVDCRATAIEALA